MNSCRVVSSRKGVDAKILLFHGSVQELRGVEVWRAGAGCMKQAARG